MKRNLKCECHLSSPQAIGMSVTFEDNNQIENYDNVTKSSIISNASLPSQHNSNHFNHNHQQHNILKKQGVSGESCNASVIGHSSDILIRKYEKDFK